MAVSQPDPGATDTTPISRGDRFGRLTAAEPGPSYRRQPRWIFLCDCGVRKLIRTADVRRGATSSCGCLREMTQSIRINRVGQRFGRLEVLMAAGRAQLTCRCDCGRVVDVFTASLVTGNTKSCGCLRRELLSTAGGATAHPLYGTWYGMISRCTRPNAAGYKNYGGRGIQVQSEWYDFWKWADYIETNLGTRPEDFSMDRIDNDGNYEAGNIRWASASGQVQNRRAFTSTGGRVRFEVPHEGHDVVVEPNGKRRCRTCVNARKRNRRAANAS